jgi:hypothetical protein
MRAHFGFDRIKTPRFAPTISPRSQGKKEPSLCQYHFQLRLAERLDSAQPSP